MDDDDYAFDNYLGELHQPLFSPKRPSPQFMLTI